MGIAEQAAAAVSSGPPHPAVGSAEEIRIRRRTLEAVLEQCHRALELLQKSEGDGDLAEEDVEGNCSGSTSADDPEADEVSAGMLLWFLIRFSHFDESEAAICYLVMVRLC